MKRKSYSNKFKRPAATLVSGEDHNITIISPSIGSIWNSHIKVAVKSEGLTVSRRQIGKIL